MRKVLLICPYEDIYPPMNGGMQRCFHIIHQLSKYFDLTIIIHQKKETFLNSALLYPSINHVNIYSTKNVVNKKDFFDYLPQRLQNALRYRWLKKSIRGSADSNFLKYYPILKTLLKTNKYDSIIIENLATLNAISVIRALDKKVKIIYDAHNVDSNLSFIQYKNGATNKKNFLAIKKQESTLYKTVNSVLVCSDTDKVAFSYLNSNKIEIGVIPNGVEIHPLRMHYDTIYFKPDYILFCGSLNYAPNVEGLIWFYKNSWPLILHAFVHLKLLVVGSGNIPKILDELKNDPSIVFTGTVPYVQPYYSKSTIAIAPLLSGSGTRLKILEAMSYGLPVVSTSIGAEGIDYTNNINIIIADDSIKFAKQSISILKSEDKKLSIQEAARVLVEDQYNWDIIGKNLYSFIK